MNLYKDENIYSLFYFTAEEDYTPQSHYVLNNILFEDIYVSLKRDFVHGTLFLLCLQNNHDMFEWIGKEIGDEVPAEEEDSDSSIVYQPFVVFERGKENPYWDDQMISQAVCNLLTRFIDKEKMKGGRKTPKSHTKSNKKGERQLGMSKNTIHRALPALVIIFFTLKARADWLRTALLTAGGVGLLKVFGYFLNLEWGD